MNHRVIRVINARQHNLKGIDVDIPHRMLVVVTGPSGSGKSSLAFDTLYAEGQRRYIESLSSYAKQFLERMPKPLVDRIEGIAPSVAIEQRAPTMSTRSTVGTATEVHDFLRLLWARIGIPYCVNCGNRVVRDTPQTAADRIVEMGGKLQILFPLPLSSNSSKEVVVENLKALGFIRIRIDGKTYRLDEIPADLKLSEDREVAVVVDRLSAEPGDRDRITEAVATSFEEGEGVALAAGEQQQLRFTEFLACSKCDTVAPQITPALFSFNNPRGACPTCNGFGATLDYAESLIVPDRDRTVRDGAIDPWTKPRYTTQRKKVVEATIALGADPDKPWSQLPPEVRETLLNGKVGRFVGIVPFLERLEKKRYKQYIRVFLRQYQLAVQCRSCGGARLKSEVLSIRLGGESISDATGRSIQSLSRWVKSLQLDPAAEAVSDLILAELMGRLEYLEEVGLGYLTLDRQTRTLSGGEAQRIALSNALGSRLVDALYVLDEPSIGLHPKDTDRLVSLMKRLRDLGNTVVVVEHDLATVSAADWMIELGPGAGEHGGEIVHSGPVADARDTLTAQYLTGVKKVGVPSLRRAVDGPAISIVGARLHNLQGVDLKVPLGTLTAITGVSGSGKSTLIHDVLRRQLERRLGEGDSAKLHLGELVGEVDSIDGWQELEAAIVVDQSPIGRSPRSNPVTYVKAFSEIRELFAAQPLAKERKYTPGTFSFNTAGGRCSECDGAGHLQVEMVFLADVYIPCEACNGSRYAREVLDVKIQGVSIAEVLEWSVDEAIIRFRHQPKLGAALWQLQQVGLGYLRLGQPATTLSGGEAQRLKIARELIGARKKKGRRLYLLDEPTTGLHLDDVRTLIGVLDKLVDAGHTVVVIEHHLDIIKRADWVVDMGPGAGPEGGKVVVMGPPEKIARSKRSHTGRYLRAVL